MGVIESVLLGVLLIVVILLIVLILFQNGKGASSGAAFGSSGGASSSMMTSSSSDSLVKVTTFFAILFFSITLGLAYIANDRAEKNRTILTDFVGEEGLIDNQETPKILESSEPSSEDPIEALKRIAE